MNLFGTTFGGAMRDTAAGQRGAGGSRHTGALHAFLLLLSVLVMAPAGVKAQSQRAPVNLGSAGNYVVLSQTGITDVPPSVITGNIGSSPITGAAIHLTCAEVIGTISAVDAAGPAPCSLIVPAALGTAILDLHTAYTDAAGRTVPDFTELGAGNISGRTLVPGLYKWSTGVMVDNTGVTLSGGPNSVWIFQIAGDVLLANNAHINLAGGANANNVFWQVGGPTAVTLGTGAVFSGNILSAAQVIMNTGATLNGRAFAFTQVTLQSTGVTNPGPLVGGIPVPLPPTVTSTVPANLSVGIATGSSLSATFSEAMDPTTINGSTFLLKNGLTPIAGTVSYVGVTATFTPAAPLPANTLLTATITTGAKDPAGIALAVNYVWTFTTGAAPDVTPPTVSSTVPANGATNVAIGSAVAATFSEAMAAGTVNSSTFLLKQGATAVAGTVSYAGVTATFTPTAALTPNTLFTATITTGVTDLAGNALAANYVWTFTTGAAPDVTAPTVSSTVPANGATNVAIGSALAATFSEAMAAGTVNSSTFLLKQGATAVAGTVSYAGVTATFTPTAALTPNTLFTATITTGVTDLAGNALAANYVWTFTTGAAPDVTPPTVSSTVPANGATNVAIGSALAATFSEAMAAGTVNSSTFLLKQGATAITGTVSYAGVTATFTPTATLTPNTLFTATITTGVTDLAGNALAANYVWTFTTGAAPDITPPTVSSTVPANGATNVAIGSALAATFSEALAAGTVNSSTFLLKQGATAVAGTVSYAGVTATFTPTAALSPNTLFTATITTGVTDLAGNVLAANYVWTFTTGAAPDVTPPTVSSTVPASGANNVPVGSALAVTFTEALDPMTVNTTSVLLKQGAVAITGTVSYAGVTATFMPLSALSPNTVFTATVTTGVTDLAGNHLATNYVWTFTTGATPDVTPPTVISTVPATGGASVSTGTALAATFSEALAPLTVSTSTFLLKQGATAVAGTVSYAGVTATFTPMGPLAQGTVYTATITTGITDLAGNALLASYVWSFTTAVIVIPPQPTPPTVISTVPANGAQAVTPSANVVANFSTFMNPQTINTATFLLTQGGHSVAGTVTYSGTAATLRPATDLAINTVYSATITTGATDLSGNSLQTNYQWTFTTGTQAGQTPVCLANFAVLGGSAIAASGVNMITGDIGVSPSGSVSGFPPGTIQGTVHTNDAVAAQAMTDLTSAYMDAVARSTGSVAVTGDVGGQTFTAGLYNSSSQLSIMSADLTLDAKGNPNAVFIFQMGSSLTIGNGRQIVLAGGAQAFNVFWQVGTSATLGASSVFQGSILASQSITLNSAAAVFGRLLARTGTVTLQSNTVTSPPPVLAASGIFNAANWSGTVAPGSIAAIFGNNLGSSLAVATSYPLLTTLGGGSIQAGTQNAPLFMTSCNQANFQVPWEVTGQTQVPFTATAGGQVSGRQFATVAPYSPGIFSLNMVGTGQGAVIIPPSTQLAASRGPLGRPVNRGEYIAIFCTGLGPVSNQPATGAPALASPLSFTSASPTLTVGGVAAEVTYSGLAPGFAGLYQVNAIIPGAAPSGSSVNLILTIQGIASNTVTIAVQ